MKSFTTCAIAAAMITAMSTASFAGDKTTAGTEDPFIAPVVPAAGSLGGGYLPVVAGVAAAALIAAAIASDSDNDSPATTTTTPSE